LLEVWRQGKAEKRPIPDVPGGLQITGLEDTPEHVAFILAGAGGVQSPQKPTLAWIGDPPAQLAGAESTRRVFFDGEGRVGTLSRDPDQVWRVHWPSKNQTEIPFPSATMNRLSHTYNSGRLVIRTEGDVFSVVEGAKAMRIPPPPGHAIRILGADLYAFVGGAGVMRWNKKRWENHLGGDPKRDLSGADLPPDAERVFMKWRFDHDGRWGLALERIRARSCEEEDRVFLVDVASGRVHRIAHGLGTMHTHPYFARGAFHWIRAQATTQFAGTP
jgi:hypothetical protein